MRIKKGILSVVYVVLTLLCVSVSAETRNNKEFPEIINKEITVFIPVFCESKNCQEVFEYRILNYGSDSVNISDDILYLKDGESGNFEIRIADPGIFHFEIIQIKGKNEEILYDDCIYEADIHCTQDRKHLLSGEVIVYRKGEKTKEDSCYYRNKKVKQGQEKTVDTDNYVADSNADEIYSADRVKTGDATGAIGQLMFEMTAAGLLCVVLVLRMCKKQKKR